MLFFHCVFSRFNSPAIKYENINVGENIHLEVYWCLFDLIQCSSSAFQISCQQIKSDFSWNAITNCGSQGGDTTSGAFSFQTTEANSEEIYPVMKYFTIYKTISDEKLMDFVGPIGNEQAFSFSYCNITSCNCNQGGILNTCDFKPTIEYCSFSDNYGKESIVHVECSTLTNYRNATGTIYLCNFVKNKIDTYGVIDTYLFYTLNIESCIIVENTLPKGYIVANRYSGTFLFVKNSQVQSQNQNTDYSGGRVYWENNIVVTITSTYGYTFYATFGCHADIPYLTPERTININFTTSVPTPISTSYLNYRKKPQSIFLRVY